MGPRRALCCCQRIAVTAAETALKGRHGRAGKIHLRNTVEQLKLVGPRSLGVALLTAGFVGMVFTIQARPESGSDA